ncbi:replicative DNA helicase [Paenibacillus melissococcoides]|uniref:DNA 5'-3' helicase n=1 Tax=Paenibacillus melissococcoides TaxID=2912268 RepID=A0ABM9G999_9BACL|nr:MULTISPECIES: replicative DNA helicase [Paenibacillus]MEB9896781.1 DnaB-like helicase C-terminal domain-containing protein [Bacillus cereus]CAH8248600.1 replicative DNA helicase [Paenibacillus melissococcoides]CAH8714285.1 replicative DNA helicase [Paenibacillus melissococcoides]CAH8719948.1 replicative DNA helicase [Paenibacillus melissococcoides]GIO79570.1 replicative DNA helicase [Paenibacillus dendritiformis]
MEQIEAEQALLGSILLEPELIDECSLQAQDMSAPEHRIIFEVMSELRQAGKPIDIVVMASEYQAEIIDAGGISYLTRLSRAVPTTVNFREYVELVRRASLWRRAARRVKDGFNLDGPEALAAELQAATNEIMDGLQLGQGWRRVSDILNGHEDVILQRQQMKGVTGARMASRHLTTMTSGHQPKELTIIAARPSVGKTAYMLNDALEAEAGGYVVGIFSLEMGELSLTERMICRLAHLDGFKLRNGMFNDEDWQRYTMARDELNRREIYIIDKGSMTINDISLKVRELRRMHPGRKVIIYIDFLQLIDGGRRFPNKQEETSFVSRSLKWVAKEYDCPVVVISSLSRAVEQRQDKRPMLSDLRESGQIESDADVVLLLYRDDYYNQETEKKNIIEIIIGKGRNIGAGIVEMVYMKNFQKLVDIEYR